MVKYPDVNVKLVGKDGNAFMIISRVSQALRKAGVDKYEIEEYAEEAMSGDYDDLLSVTSQWVEVS